MFICAIPTLRDKLFAVPTNSGWRYISHAGSRPPLETPEKTENANAWAPQILRLPKLDWPGMTQSGTVEVSETQTLR
jgi:hypothetical protein